MDLREMQYLLEIGKTHHLTQAAHNLFISQPALSKTLRKVELELGTSLFYREGNQLLPTDTGIVFLDKARTMLNMKDDLLASLSATQNLQQGKVNFGFPSIVGTLYLSECFIGFQHTYPGIQLNPVENGGFALTELTSSGELDLAIVMRPIYTDTLNEIPVIRDQVVVCVDQNHPLASRPYITIGDFKDMPFITFDSTFNVRTVLMKRFHDENIRPNIVWSGASGHCLYKYARLSGHPLVLPRPMIKLCCGDDPVRLIPFQPTFTWELSLIFRKNAYLSTATKALISYMQNYFLNQ